MQSRAWMHPGGPVVAAVALFGWLCVLAWILPYDPDEAVYSIVARGIFDGHWPYRDLFDHKLPLIYLWYIPAGLGANIETMRVVAAAATALSVLPFAVLARRWLERRQRPFAVGGYALFLANPFLAVGANVEAFVLLPLVSSLAVTNTWLAGAFFGFAVMTKPIAILFAPVLVMHHAKSSWRLAVAATAVGIVVSAPFLPIWRDFLDANVAFNFDYARQGEDPPWARILEVNLPVLLGELPILAVAFVGVVTTRHRVLWVIAMASVFSLSISSYHYAHYYALAAPAVAMAAGAGISRALEWQGRRRVVFRELGVTLVMLAAALWIGGIAVAVSRDEPTDDLRTALRSTAGELYVLGDRSQIYAYADRQPRRRFFYSVPLVVRPTTGTRVREDLASCPPAAMFVPIKNGFQVPWYRDIRSWYEQEQTFESGTLLTRPLRPCRSASLPR